MILEAALIFESGCRKRPNGTDLVYSSNAKTTLNIGVQDLQSRKKDLAALVGGQHSVH
jgi:hypothetical protein